MQRGIRFRRIAVGVGKLLAFVGTIYALNQLVVFTALRFVSAKYWSRYDGRGLNEPWFLSSSIASLAVVLFACFVFLKYVEKRDWSYVRLRARRGMSFFATGLLVSLGTVALFVAIAITTDVVQLTVSIGPPLRVVLYLLLVLIGGFALVVLEELIFRGYALRVLETSFNGSVAVVASALLFGLAHIARANLSALGVVNICLMGCLLALVCLRWGSLWLAIGLHFGWNSFLYLANFPVSGTAYPNPLFDLEYKRYSLIGGSAFGPEDSVVVTVLMTILLSGALAWHRSRRTEDGATEPEPVRRDVGT